MFAAQGTKQEDGQQDTAQLQFSQVSFRLYYIRTKFPSRARNFILVSSAEVNKTSNGICFVKSTTIEQLFSPRKIKTIIFGLVFSDSCLNLKYVQVNTVHKCICMDRFCRYVCYIPIFICQADHYYLTNFFQMPKKSHFLLGKMAWLNNRSPSLNCNIYCNVPFHLKFVSIQKKLQ